MDSAGMPVSPALTASEALAAAIPEALLTKASNASTPSIAPTSKKTTPKQGDGFAASLGYGGKDCEPLASMTDVPGEDAAGAVRLMKNLLFAPTHKSYEKMAQTKGHAPTAAELMCETHVLPAICRDSTKFTRPVVPLLRIFEDTSVQLTYVVYGNDAPPGKKTYTLYNLDDAHGVALSSNVRRYVSKVGGWCKRNLVDHQIKYILTSLVCLAETTDCHKDHLPLCTDSSSWARIYKACVDAPKMSIGLLVVDGLPETDVNMLKRAYAPDLMPDNASWYAIKGMGLMTAFADDCDNTYVHKEYLYTLLDMALLKTKNRLPKPALTPPPAEAPVVSKKRPQAVDTSDYNDSDNEPLAPPPKKPTPAEKPAEKPKKKKKKAMSDDDEEDETSGSGSDLGSNSETDDDSESEEEDSEEEDDDDSDDNESQKKLPKTVTKSMPVATTPGGTATSPAPADEPVRLQMRQPGTSKADKEKRKPAKSRRQSMEKTIAGILRQGKGLDDAVPAQNQDKLSERMADVEKTLRIFVEEGKVVHVHELLHASWGLVSELFTIVNAIGRAGGPAPLDSAVSRRLAITMGRLVDSESKDIEDLSCDLASWASKLAQMVAKRAQVAMQGDQDARQLLPPAPN